MQHRKITNLPRVGGTGVCGDRRSYRPLPAADPAPIPTADPGDDDGADLDDPAAAVAPSAQPTAVPPEPRPQKARHHRRRP